MQRPRILAAGRFGATVAGLAEALPDSAAAEELAATVVVPGGLGLTLRTAVRLGLAAQVIGYVGDDALAAAVRSELVGAGIDARLLVAEGSTPVSLAVITLAGPRRLRSRPTRTDVGAVAADLGPAVGGAAALAIDGSEPALQRTAARLARAAGVPVIARLHGVSDAERELIAEASVLIVSERVAAEFAPRGELDDALRELQAMGPALVVITMGSAGVIARHGERRFEIAARQTDVLDASGAGDVLLGAIIAGLVSDLPAQACLEFGVTAAGLACQSLGVWHGIPSRDALLAALA